MTVTIFRLDSFKERRSFKISHATMFDESGEVTLHASNIDNERDKLVSFLLDAHVLFRAQGDCITLLVEKVKRVNIRFDR